MEYGIPTYRNFLFERLSKALEIKELLVLHTGRIYSNDNVEFNNKTIKFIGNNKVGLHIGVLKYIFKYDIIISSYNLRMISCWFPVFLKKKWIFWGKGLGSNDSFLTNFLRKITAKKAFRILIYNQNKKDEFLSKINIDEAKLIPYNNTIFVSNPENLSRENKKYFLYFGRIQERKGLLELLYEYRNYLNNLKRGSKCFRLRIVGDGEYLENLKEHVEKLNVEDYIDFFPGVYHDEKIKEHFREAIAYVSPYNVGLGVVNSFAYGVPVITCKEPQIGPEFYYLTKTNSVVVDKTGDLSNVFQSFSDSKYNHLDPYTYYYENLSADNMVEKFKEVIKQVYYE